VSLALISTVPTVPERFLEWSFSHMAHHRDINHAILLQFGDQFPEFPLDPIDFDDPEEMLYNHQTMHNNQNSVLGIAGNDLLSVDFGDIDQRSAWIWLNFQEHLQANAKLGV
jgi:hypothetical protein